MFEDLLEYPEWDFEVHVPRIGRHQPAVVVLTGFRGVVFWSLPRDPGRRDLAEDAELLIGVVEHQVARGELLDQFTATK
ncbi:hypothetical protein CFK38_11395 [Brachybacterium vulturis]|uniref:Uncharacterized protein n=1 Tax=Brachybacterium vulturis TaxID=2017484 RepID=A0A291GPZ0_9MICO|nr:hypothetical protein CFK38_11395 [Brachybacterium vulturis]